MLVTSNMSPASGTRYTNTTLFMCVQPHRNGHSPANTWTLPGHSEQKQHLFGKQSQLGTDTTAAHGGLCRGAAGCHGPGKDAALKPGCGDCLGHPSPQRTLGCSKHATHQQHPPLQRGVMEVSGPDLGVLDAGQGLGWNILSLANSISLGFFHLE